MNGNTFTITQWFDDPASELRILEVAQTIPSYAPLYFRSDEVNRDVVVIGRGTQRGAPVYVDGALRGWQWGWADSVQRWGTNQISSADGYVLYATFDSNGGPNECHLTGGDSGGATFMQDNGIWKLAGINYSVDGPFSSFAGGALFNASLFDFRGLYDAAGQLLSSPTVAPSGFYGVRISSRLDWIYSIVFPNSPVPTPTPTPSSSTLSTVARMLTPSPGARLDSQTVTFHWTTAREHRYRVNIGTAPGRSDIYRSGRLKVTSVAVGNFPTNGKTVYVRLFSQVDKDKWRSRDYSYTSYGYNPPPIALPSAATTTPSRL